MTVVTLSKVTGLGSGQTLEIRNIESITADYDSNSTLFALPESSPQDAMAMKVAGSALRYRVTYILNNEDTTVVSGKSISTGDQQHLFLTNYDGNNFPPVGFEDFYELDLGFGVLVKGMIQSINFTKNKGETVWTATINFDVGKGISTA